MENEIQPTPQTIPIEVTPTKPTIILPLVLLGLIIAAGSVYIGIQIGKNQTPSQQPVVSLPEATPTPSMVIPSVQPTIEPNADLTADWKTYKDAKSGIEVKYPKDVLLNGEQKGSDKLALYIRIKDLDNYVDEPMGLDLKTAISDKNSLENGNYGSNTFGANYPNSQKVIKLDNLYAKTYISFREIEVCDVRFSRGLIFYKNNYQIRLTLNAPVSYSSKMPEYFTLDSASCGNSPVWKSPDKFYSDLTNNNKAPQIALDWYNLFDQILSTIKPGN